MGGAGVPEEGGGGAKFCAENIWHQFMNTTENFGTKPPRLWHKNKHRPRMVVVITCGLVVACCYFLEATELKIPWHYLAPFCCAKFCHSKLCLFKNSPWYVMEAGGCACLVLWRQDWGGG